MRLAVLVTNTDRSAFAARHPRDGRKWAEAMALVRPDWWTTAFDLTLDEVPAGLDDFDGAIIGGSPASVNGGEPWIKPLMDLIRHPKVPLFGACFGHQAIAVALGGTVGPAPAGLILGVTTTQMRACAPWMDPVASLRVNAANGEQVLRLPPGAEVLLGSDDCPVGAYRIGATVFACQYHPEMSDGFIADLVAEHGSDLPQGARAGLSPPADRLLLLGWIARFFEQAAPRATRIIVQK